MTAPIRTPGTHPGTGPATPRTAAETAGTLTGKRRLALACPVDESHLPHFLALLRSLALTNPALCEDLLVLTGGPDAVGPASAERIHALHPRAEIRPLPAAVGTDGTARPGLLDVFRVRGYDTVIALEPDMVVLGDLGPLLRRRDGVAAAHRDADGLPAGPLAVQSSCLTDAFTARLDASSGHGGARAVLSAALADGFSTLDDPDGHATDDEHRRPYEMWEADFDAAYVALDAAAHHDLLVHYGTRHVARTGDLDAARKVASARIAAGEYEEAVEILRQVSIPVNTAWPHEVFGHALMSVSAYEEARAQLLLATAAPKRAASAFGRLAQLAWIHWDDDQAQQYALSGLAMDPTHQTCRQLQQRTRSLPAPQEGPADEQLAHVAYYMPQQGNAGDKLLPESVRLTFGRDPGPRHWHSLHAHRLFDEKALARVNARRGLVIGGGGLFIPDTAPNGNSGWQWNVPDALLDRIDVPIVVHAVGFNTFDGQSYRRERFHRALRRLVERSAFFGLRNHGSIEKVRALLPPGLHDRVRFQPCPTTVTRHLIDGWRDVSDAERENTVLVNAAYDRSGLRFGHDYGHFLAEMASAVRALGAHAEVRCVAHSLDDERIAFDLRREHGISMPVIPMYDFDNTAIRDTYARTRLVIGMRGHAGMIPFGCGTPIISLVSHPKMTYFLADIGRPEWGVSVHDRHLGSRLTELAVSILDDHPNVVADVHARQQELWEVTRANSAELRDLLGGVA